MKKSTAIRIVAIILGVIVIPLAYSILYLKAFNDPYSKLETLPIAVVNKDKGAAINGKDRNIGNEMVNELKDDKQLKWVFTDDEDSEKGLDGTKYYAVITIPESFSKDVSSAEDSKKTPATIYYKANEKRNYLAAQILSRAMLELQQKVSSNVDKEITLGLTDKINEVPKSLDELNGHLGDLKDGTQKIADGQNTYNGKVKDVSNAVGQLRDGSQQAADGQNTFNEKLKLLSGAVGQLNDGENYFNGKVNEVSGAIGQLNDGMQKVADGQNTFNGKVNDVSGAVGQLNDGMQKVADGQNTFNGKVKDVSGAVGQLNDGINKIHSGSTDLKNGISEYKTNFDLMVSQEAKINNGVIEIHKNMPSLVGGINSLDQGVNKLFLGSTALSKGLSQFTTGFNQFAAGQKALNNVVNAQLPNLIGGIQQLNTGASNLSNATTQYVSGVDILQQDYAKLISDLQGCINSEGKIDSVKFYTIMNGLKNDQESMKTKSQQLTAAGQMLKSGSSNLSKGASQLNDNVVGIQTLQKSINQLQTATEDLQKATAALQQGSDALVKGTSDAKTGADALNQGAQKLSPGTDELQAGVAKLTEALAQFQQATNKLSAGSSTLNMGTLQAKNGLNTLNGNMSAFVNGSNQLTNGASAASKGLNQLNGNMSAFVDGSNQLTNGASAASKGLNQLNGNMSAFVDGSNKLNNGLNQLNGNMPALVDGSNQLNNGNSKLNNGLNQLNSNMPAFVDASNQLKDGTAKINDGAHELKDGINDKINDTNKELTKLDKLDEYSANPVSLTEEKLDAVPNYGTAFAPYFMSLSLWVGALIMFFGIYLDPDKRMPLLSRTSNRKLVRVAGFFGIGLAQAIALAILVKMSLGLQVNNIGGYFLACILVSMVFISIVQFFIIHLGDVGKLFGILLLILQLTSCGGTFPMETVPSFFNWLYPFMPMTYSVNILKETISGHSSDIVVKNALILVAIGAVFTALTIVLSLLKKSKNEDISTPAHA